MEASGEARTAIRIDGLAEVVLNVRDRPRALAFYRDLLGLEELPGPPQPAPIFLRAGAATPSLPALLVLVQLEPGTAKFAPPRTLHHLALTIPAGAYEATEGALEQAGHEVRRGHHPILGTQTLYVFDPDGNEVELIAPTT